MRHETGASLKGIPQSQGARIGVIHISPDDDRRAVLTAILAEEKLKRAKIVLDLPSKNKAFQRPEDFDDLKMLRRKLQADLIFVTPAGPGPADFARQRRFTVFSSMDSFVRSSRSGGSGAGQSEQPAAAAVQPGNKGGKGSLFGGRKKAEPAATSARAGTSAGVARRSAQSGRRP